MKDTLNFEKALTTEEAAQILGVKARTLVELRFQKQGPSFVKIGRLIRYRYRDLMKYLDQNTVPPDAA